MIQESMTFSPGQLSHNLCLGVRSRPQDYYPHSPDHYWGSSWKQGSVLTAWGEEKALDKDELASWLDRQTENWMDE